MPTTCDINFENPERVFYAGQLLSGTVRLTLTKEHKVRGVYIRIFGRAYAYWTEHCSTDHNRHLNRNNENHRASSGHHVSFEGKEDYLDEKTYFVGGQNASEFRLPPGVHSYTFQCMLPIGLPTSVEHGVGHITYGANVVMDIPMWPDKEFKEHFTVIKPINLNLDPSFRSPAIDKDERVFYPLGCFCCWPSGPLFVDAYAPVRGYTPGQTINVKVNVNNESDEGISNFEVALIKQITFYGHAHHDGRYESKQKVIDQVITSEETRGCDAEQKDSICVNLRVPSIPPTDFSTSNVVHVKYWIRVIGSIDSCCRSNVVLNLPITIGTYPIQDDVDTSNMHFNYPNTVISNQPQRTTGVPPSQNGSAPPNPMSMPMPQIPAPPYSSMPTAPNMPATSFLPTAPSAPYDLNDNPPTYEEAMSSAQGNSGNSGNTENSNKFTPKYPMFRRETSYSIDLN